MEPTSEYWQTIDRLDSFTDDELFGLAEAIKAKQNFRKETKEQSDRQ